MAAHSSVLVWRNSGTAEPGGLPIYGVTQSRTRLKRLSSSSSHNIHLILDTLRVLAESIIFIAMKNA